MKIHYSTDNIKLETSLDNNSFPLEETIRDLRGITPVVTIGIFDGVHTGHVALLNKTAELAKLYNKESLILTFYPHPRIVLSQDKGKLKLLTTQSEKMRQLARLEIDNILILPFTFEIASLTAEQFIEEFLVKQLNVSRLVIGNNHRFGKGGISFGKLEKICKKFNIGLDKFALIDISNLIPSSTKIRDLLLKGNIQQANKLLGYNYSIEGKVIEGDKIGRELSFPTANLSVSEPKKLVPANGVYACYVKVRDKTYKGMANIGFRPTIVKKNRHSSIEVHILDFDENIYYENIEIEFVEKIRDEIHFPNLKDLIKQIELDKLYFPLHSS
ncbi:MAG: bifunctional riboflavin kinase/FAD synthetase [Marinilabiliaceae bacterium]|nr:bifunctional riboflavin kinase/FAD synthetase [Marinilabiliaceae bacterium]